MEEKELVQSELEVKADEINKGRSADVKQSVSVELGLSPLEEIRKLNADTKKNLEIMQKEREKMEKQMADLWLSGRGQAGSKPKEITQEDRDIEAANRILSLLRKK